MKRLALLTIALFASHALVSAQTEKKPGVPRQATNLVSEQDNDIVDEVFSPITGRLNLTASQKFRIANIATDTMLRAEPLFQQLDEMEDQLSEAAFTGRLDESTIRQVSEKQATVLGQIISMKSRAKMSFYRVLTAEQRALVAGQFRSRIAEGNLGSISN